MNTLKTQIRNLKKEIKRINEEEIKSKKSDQETLNKFNEDKKLLTEYKKRYFELLDEYEDRKKILDKYLDKKFKIKEEVNSKIWFFKKSYSEINFPKDLERSYDIAYRRVREVEKDFKKLDKDYYNNMFLTVGTGAYGLILNREEIINHFESQFRRVDRTIKNFENRLNGYEEN
ncbi:MAG: hypothetical protein WEA58_05595 [Balneolaceae bacterium]